MIKVELGSVEMSGTGAVLLAECMLMVKTIVTKVGPEIGLNNVEDLVDLFDKYDEFMVMQKNEEYDPSEVTKDILKQAKEDSK